MTNLLYSDVEESLRASVKDALARELTASDVAALYDDPRGGKPELWDRLAKHIGVGGLLIPEDRGGAGASAREAAVVLEELGVATAPVPFLTSSVIATTVLLGLDDRSLLPSLAAGDQIAALLVPWTAAAGHWRASLQPDADGGQVVSPVAGALDADVFLLPVGGSETTLVVLQRDEVTVEPLSSFDMSRQLATVTRIAAGRTIARGDHVVAAVDRGLMTGAALLASEQLGIAQQCLTSTVDYVKTRIQFARALGSFQALKHRLADLYLDVALAQAAARYAADVVARDAPDAPIAVAVAQSWCSDISVRAAEEAVQLHGGIGMTWEHPAHLALKRAKSNQVALGRPTQHRRDLSDLVGLSPARSHAEAAR